MATSMILPLIQKLSSLLMDEANYLSQAKPEVESFCKELNLMTTSSLKEADAIHHKSERAKDWVRQLKELVFEAEDSIDVFVCEMAQKRLGGVVSKLPKLLINAHQLKGKLEDIKAKIKKLSEERMNYDIKPLEEVQTSAQAHQGEASCKSIDIMQVDVGGLQSKADELVKLLMQEEPRGQFGVVSITGVSILAKTTLAHKIYNRDDVKEHFDCQAYVYISKEYEMRDVLCNIIKQVMILTEEEKKTLASEEVEKLKEKLSEFLRDKENSLFVLDDVWRTEDWDELKRFLPVPCNYQQWRVLLTTRDEVTIRHAGPNAPPYKLQLLDEEKKFTELPNHLKLCFLYFGFFPRGAKIQRDRLIRLWVAEGFLGPKRELTIEEVGGECLEELMQRNLIQVAKWKSNGVPESFIIHDLFLNLAISIAKEGNFLEISTPHQESWKYSRHVALRDNGGKDTMAEAFSLSSSGSSSSNKKDTMAEAKSSESSSSNVLRSLLCFTEINPSLLAQFKLLNVLDLEGAPGIESLPKEIGNLIFLKYLSLCRTSLKTLPPWVRNLYNLQTLNLYKTMIQSVPIEIFELDKLRHLLCFSKCWVWESDGFIVESVTRASQRLSPARIQNLRDLQTLWFHSSSWINGGLEKLTNLRELGLSGFGAHIDHKYALFRALSKLQRLEVLYLVQLTLSGFYEIHLPSFSGHSYLYNITIIGVLPKLPDPNNLPSKLTRLRLASSNLKEDMMETLEKLPNLKELKLDPFTYVGVVMKCTAGGFPKLENLSLRLFPFLIIWIVKKGAMPNLRKLEIDSLMNLRWIPPGLRHITGLQKLSLAMPKEFLNRVKEGGEDWKKISHVPSIVTREVQQIPETDIMSRNIPRDTKELSCNQPHT